jgi:hypothetical protein
MKKVVKPAYEDPENSVDLFDGDRKNKFGETYCVAPAILPREVSWFWNRYQKTQEKKNFYAGLKIKYHSEEKETKP